MASPRVQVNQNAKMAACYSLHTMWKMFATSFFQINCSGSFLGIFIFFTVRGIYIFMYFVFGRACIKHGEILLYGQRYFHCVTDQCWETVWNQAVRRSCWWAMRLKNLPPQNSKNFACVSTHGRDYPRKRSKGRSGQKPKMAKVRKNT